MSKAEVGVFTGRDRDVPDLYILAQVAGLANTQKLRLAPEAKLPALVRGQRIEFTRDDERRVRTVRIAR